MDTNTKNRIFIATYFIGANKELSCAINSINSLQLDYIKPVLQERAHVTWKFIGNIDVNKNQKIFEIVQVVSESLKNKSITFDELKLWPNLKDTRLISLVSSSYDKEFADYFHSIDNLLFDEFDIKKETKKFVPHITLARFKKNKNKVDISDIKIEPITLKFDNVRLMQSISTSFGVDYKILYEEKY